jgi:hypothetical protein
MAAAKRIKEVVANRFVLKSPKGKVRAWFDASSEDSVSLDLIGSKSRLTLTIDSDGNPKISLWNKKGRAGISIGISDDMGNGITLHDSEGRPVCFIEVRNDGIPRITFFQVTSPTKGEKFWETPAPKRKGRRTST